LRISFEGARSRVQEDGLKKGCIALDSNAGVMCAKNRDGTRAAKSPSRLKEQSMTRGRRKSIEELAAEQGVRPTRLDDIVGRGADLWESDLELERFVEDIYARRKEDRELAKE